MHKQLKYLFILGYLFFSPSAFAHALIINPHTPTAELSRNSIRAIFAMRTPQWSDGTPVHVFVLADNHPLHTSFCKESLGMFPYQLRRIWDRQVFSGTGIAPTTVKSIAEMRERVANTAGAIGYIQPDQVNESVIQISEGF